jgi:hypothetical protein
MSMKTSMKVTTILAGLGVAVTIGAISTTVPAVWAATPPKAATSSGISEEASTAVAQMGKSLLATQLSFQVRTLRAYAESSGQPLHIAHSMKITVRRPDRMFVDLTGDDGATKFYYDGKTVVLMGVETKKYATLAVPNTIQGMLETVVGKHGVDFPLADLLTDAPDKAFLLGVTSGRQVNIVTIDGVPCRHLLFTQPPGIEIELWVEQRDRALPRRLIITYRSQPGQPSFIAEFSGWDSTIHPTDADFAFTPPPGAEKTELIAAAPPPAAKKKGSGQ